MKKDFKLDEAIEQRQLSFVRPEKRAAFLRASRRQILLDRILDPIGSAFEFLQDMMLPVSILIFYSLLALLVVGISG